MDELNDVASGSTGVHIERSLQAKDRQVVVVAAAAAEAAPEQTRVDKVMAEMQTFFDKTATVTRPAVEVAAAGGKLFADGAQDLCAKSKPLLEKTAADTAEVFDLAAAGGARALGETRIVLEKTAASGAEVAGRVQEKLRAMPTETAGMAALAGASNCKKWRAVMTRPVPKRRKSVPAN